jgi:hypothetical protein
MPTYHDFRTGLTFATVRQMMWSGGPPSEWRSKSRRAVLGYWHELKQQLYAQLEDQWEA